MRHAARAAATMCCTVLYCCYNTDRKNKKEGPSRLNLFFLWGWQRRKNTAWSVVTTEKTRGLFKSLWLFGEEGRRNVQYRVTVWTSNKRAPLATLYLLLSSMYLQEIQIIVLFYLWTLCIYWLSLSSSRWNNRKSHTLTIYPATILAHLDFNLNISVAHFLLF